MGKKKEGILQEIEIEGIEKIYCGKFNTFLLSNKEVFVSGYNLNGELSIGTNFNIYSFSKIELKDIIDIIPGNAHTKFISSKKKIL